MYEFDKDRLELLKSFTVERLPESVQAYTQEYRLYLERKPNGNIAGYVLGESHCGSGRGCFWTDEQLWSTTLEEFNSIKHAVQHA